MLFNSQIFLSFFLPLVLFSYFLCTIYFRDIAWLRKVILLLASWLFYAWWDARFLPLLICSILVNWLVSRLFIHFKIRKTVTFGIAFNLFLIGYFKYKNFFIENMSVFLDFEPSSNAIVLPIGISFFTFQQIAYLVDLKKKRAPLYGLLDYSVFISFFPQLIAGPIVRHSEFMPQLMKSPLRDGLSERLSRGLTLLTIGLAKKIIFADTLGKHANSVFDIAKSMPPSLSESWSGTIAFSLQIYFDFSAYSDMAIGLGLLFGFILPVNFNSPYKARSLQEFWRRWHITLSNFLKDYLYIPLGGNRYGFVRQVSAAFVTMSLCGFWHGAGWTFVIWGVWHGAGLIAVITWNKVFTNHLKLKIPSLFSWVITLFFVTVGWVFFRAEDFLTISHMFQAMSDYKPSEVDSANVLKKWHLVFALMVVLFFPNSQKLALNSNYDNRLSAIFLGLILSALFLELGKGGFPEFIYFEF